MKNILLTSALLIALSVTASAQTVGILIQPEFGTSNTMKGFFAETSIVKGLGIYADYKFLNKENRIAETARNQINAGLSLKVMSGLKAFASTSVMNQERNLYRNEWAFANQSGSHNLGSEYQVGVMYSASMLSVLGAYETGGSRVTIGIGFNLNY